MRIQTILTTFILFLGSACQQPKGTPNSPTNVSEKEKCPSGLHLKCAEKNEGDAAGTVPSKGAGTNVENSKPDTDESTGDMGSSNSQPPKDESYGEWEAFVKLQDTLRSYTLIETSKGRELLEELIKSPSESMKKDQFCGQVVYIKESLDKAPISVLLSQEKITFANLLLQSFDGRCKAINAPIMAASSQLNEIFEGLKEPDRTFLGRGIQYLNAWKVERLPGRLISFCKAVGEYADKINQLESAGIVPAASAAKFKEYLVEWPKEGKVCGPDRRFPILLEIVGAIKEALPEANSAEVKKALEAVVTSSLQLTPQNYPNAYEKESNLCSAVGTLNTTVKADAATTLSKKTVTQTYFDTMKRSVANCGRF